MILKKSFMAKASLIFIATNIISAYAMEPSPQDKLKVPSIFTTSDTNSGPNSPRLGSGSGSPTKGLSGFFKTSSKEVLRSQKKEKEKHKILGTMWEYLSPEQKIKALAPYGCQDEDGNTPLILAIKYQYDQLCFDLISMSNVDVNQADATGRTPLMHAVICDNICAVKLLLSHKHINVNAQDCYGNTALHHAALHVRPNILGILIVNPLIQSSITNNERLSFYQIVTNNNDFEENLRKISFARTMIDSEFDRIVPSIGFLFPVEMEEEKLLDNLVLTIRSTDFRYKNADPEPLPDCFTDELIKKIARVRLGTISCNSSSNTDFKKYYKES